MRIAGLLGAGKGGQVVIMLAVTALTARTLGVTDFGTLILIQTVILAVGKIARFQTWRALVYYGAMAREAKDKARLQRIIKFSGLLDILTGLVAFLIVIVVSGSAIKLFGLAPAFNETMQLYGSVILLMTLNGTPNGILQLFDRFDRIAWLTIVAPLVRLAGSLYLFTQDGSLIDFLIVWYLADAVSVLALLLAGLFTLREEGLTKGLFKRSPSLFVPEVGIWRYVTSTQLASTLGVSTTHLPVLFVGALLGASEAGLFRVAREFAGVLAKPGPKLFGRAIYAELARLTARNAYAARRQMIVKTSLLVGSMAFLVFTVFVVLGQQFIDLTVGPAFSGIYGTMIWLSFAGVITSTGFALEPTLVATGSVNRALLARFVSTMVFIPLLYVLLLQIGIIGAGMAGVVYSVMLMSLMYLSVRPKLATGSVYDD